MHYRPVPAYTDVSHFRAPYLNAVLSGFGQVAVTSQKMTTTPTTTTAMAVAPMTVAALRVAPVTMRPVTAAAVTAAVATLRGDLYASTTARFGKIICLARKLKYDSRGCRQIHVETKGSPFRQRVRYHMRRLRDQYGPAAVEQLLAPLADMIARESSLIPASARIRLNEDYRRVIAEAAPPPAVQPDKEPARIAPTPEAVLPIEEVLPIEAGPPPFMPPNGMVYPEAAAMTIAGYPAKYVIGGLVVVGGLGLYLATRKK